MLIDAFTGQTDLSGLVNAKSHMSIKFVELTLMLLIWRIVQPHGDEDEEDQERPDDLHQELKLRDGKRQEVMSAMTTHPNNNTHTLFFPSDSKSFCVKQEAASCLYY